MRDNLPPSSLGPLPPPRLPVWSRCHENRSATRLLILGFVLLLIRWLAPLAEGADGRGRGWDMDYGPVQSYTVSENETNAQGEYANLVTKGVAIRLGTNAAVLFDTELLRYAAGWTGGYLNLKETHLTSAKGSLHVRIAGKVLWRSAEVAGVALHGESIQDPRPTPVGCLPSSRGRYEGYFRSGHQVVLHYSVGGTKVFDMPSQIGTHEHGAFIRDILLAPSPSPIQLVLCQGSATSVATSGSSPAPFTQLSFTGHRGKEWMAAVRSEVGATAELITVNGHLVVRVAPAGHARKFRVALALATAGGMEKVWMQALQQPLPDLGRLTQGGEALWPDPQEAPGHLGRGQGPFIVDSIPVPESNPWQSWLRLTALDFFEDGRAAVSTWNGDVWMVSGLDETLTQVRWKRFAAGLFEGLGLKIVHGVVHVLERHQITRLHDLNGDGEADYYENFHNEAPIGPSYHAFSFGLETDSQGRFYFTRCGHRVDPDLPFNGGLIRVSADGRTTEQLAHGMRAPNGLSIGPMDQITTADNQGNWVPTSRIDWIKPGGFYGFVPHAHQTIPPTDYEKPICWVPYDWDNSSASQIWVPPGVWGPMEGQLLHLSYGKAALFHVLPDWSDHQVQGAITKLPLTFASGLMRGRFHPGDGQLYVCGLLGWQTRGVRDGALQRVRFTGQPLERLVRFKVLPHGVRLQFDVQLDPPTAQDTGNYGLEQWNYRWSEQYGSPEYSVQEPTRQGRDPVELNAAVLLEDRRTVELRIPQFRPVMQLRIQYRLRSSQGHPMRDEIYATINQLPAVDDQ